MFIMFKMSKILKGFVSDIFKFSKKNPIYANFVSVGQKLLCHVGEYPT